MSVDTQLFLSELSVGLVATLDQSVVEQRYYLMHAKKQPLLVPPPPKTPSPKTDVLRTNSEHTSLWETLKTQT